MSDRASEQVSEWMSEWLSEWREISGWLSGWLLSGSEWVIEWIGGCVHGCVCEWVAGGVVIVGVIRWKNEWVREWAYGCASWGRGVGCGRKHKQARNVKWVLRRMEGSKERTNKISPMNEPSKRLHAISKRTCTSSLYLHYRVHLKIHPISPTISQYFKPHLWRHINLTPSMRS